MSNQLDEKFIKIGKISIGTSQFIGHILYISKLNYKIIKEKLNPILIKDLDNCLDDFIYQIDINNSYVELSNKLYRPYMSIKLYFIYTLDKIFEFDLMQNLPWGKICEIKKPNNIFKDVV